MSDPSLNAVMSERRQLINLAYRLLGSAGEWIPEPLPGDASDDPADRVTLDESINMAFLVVLEAMTPAERVAFILHDVFCYPFAEVAEIGPGDSLDA